MINWNFCNTRCGKWVAHQRAAHESPAPTKADQSTASPFGWVQVGSVDEEENWDAAYLRRSSPLAPCPTPHRSAQSSMRERSRIAVPAHPAPSRRSPSRVAGDGSRRRRRTAALASSMSRRGGLRGSATSQTVVGLPRLAVGWRVGCARRGVAGPSSFHPAVVTGERWERNPASASRAVVDIHRGPPVDRHPPRGMDEMRPTCWRAATDGPGVRRGGQTGKNRRGCVRGDRKTRVCGGPPRWCVGAGIVRGGRAAATGQSPTHSA